MFRQILIAVSGDSDRTALSAAVELAREHRAAVTVMHVVNWMVYVPGAEFLDGGMMLEHAEQQGREVLACAADWLKDTGCDVETCLVIKGNWDGSVGKAIADFARERCVDLIVLGRRPTDWWHWTEENVSSQLERHANVPVLIAADGKIRRSPVTMQWPEPQLTVVHGGGKATIPVD
jgi:nucleotide-binding universal stress UspA family protein